MKNIFSISALLGAAMGGRIPLIKKELTKDMIMGQLRGIDEKFLGGG